MSHQLSTSHKERGVLTGLSNRVGCPLAYMRMVLTVCIGCPGCKPHATPVDSLHITIYMTSQPGDPRPDPFINFGGGQSYVLAEGRIPACSPSVLEAEQRVFRELAASTAQPVLEVYPHNLDSASSSHISLLSAPVIL